MVEWFFCVVVSLSDEISLLPLEELQEEADNTEMKTLSGRN